MNYDVEKDNRFKRTNDVSCRFALDKGKTFRIKNLKQCQGFCTLGTTMAYNKRHALKRIQRHLPFVNLLSGVRR